MKFLDNTIVGVTSENVKSPNILSLIFGRLSTLFYVVRFDILVLGHVFVELDQFALSEQVSSHLGWLETLD